MSKRNEIQQEALHLALNHKRCGLGISMGVGKTLIGLRYLESLHNQGLLNRALIVAPKLSIFQSWSDDAQKFGIDQAIIDKMSFTTYLSLHKHQPGDYDTVVLDECHSLLFSHGAFLGFYDGRILGLTGTPPRYHNSEKGQMVARYCPILYKYITDDAVDDQILNNYRIIVHQMPLSEENDLPVTTKNGKFYTSERKSYDYWTKRKNEAFNKKQEQIASIMRMRVMMDFRSKEQYAKKLMVDFEDKCIVFCNTQEQAERMSKWAIHSGNPNAEELLRQLKDGEINQASCVLQLNEGVNIKDLQMGIILHAYGNERKSSQRIGRLLRLNPDEMAIVHVMCYEDTVDEYWVKEALKDFDQSKIMYHKVNEHIL